MKESFMKRVLALTAGVAMSALAGCYIVPIDPANPQMYQQAVPGAAPQPAPALPVQPVPASMQARLYPLNEMAGKMGALTALVTDNANGHATFTVSHAGEVLRGEATRVPEGYAGFGKVHAEVYGTNRMPAGQRGIASAAGTQGSYVNCEYALTRANRGTGACLFSNGAKYQLHFGS
jgi:hypothetical protein